MPTAPPPAPSSVSEVGTTPPKLSAGLDCSALTPQLAVSVLPSAVQGQSSVGQGGCTYHSPKVEVGKSPTTLAFGYGQFPPKGNVHVATVFGGLRDAAKGSKTSGFKMEPTIGDGAFSTDQDDPAGGRDAKVQWAQGRRLYGLELHGYPKSQTEARAKLLVIAEKLAVGNS